MTIYGINPVLEALRAGRVTSLRIDAGGGGKGASERLRELVALAEAGGVPVKRIPREALERAARGGVHQGVVADVEDVRKEWTPGELVRGARGVPLLIVLDGIEDPQNVGAIMRTADAVGADGVIVQSRRSAALGGAAAKASAGAITHVRIAEVVNIARSLDELKELGVWTVGLAGEATSPYYSIDFTVPTALVLGAEGTGLRRLVREKCDWLASIPMQGHVGSLNVSVAAGVALFEVARQRTALR